MEKTVIFVRGELVFDELDKVLHRVKGYSSDGYVVLMDRNTLIELPDYRHPTQVIDANEYFRNHYKVTR